MIEILSGAVNKLSAMPRVAYSGFWQNLITSDSKAPVPVADSARVVTMYGLPFRCFSGVKPTDHLSIIDLMAGHQEISAYLSQSACMICGQCGGLMKRQACGEVLNSAQGKLLVLSAKLEMHPALYGLSALEIMEMHDVSGVFINKQLLRAASVEEVESRKIKKNDKVDLLLRSFHLPLKNNDAYWIEDYFRSANGQKRLWLVHGGQLEPKIVFDLLKPFRCFNCNRHEKDTGKNLQIEISNKLYTQEEILSLPIKELYSLIAKNSNSGSEAKSFLVTLELLDLYGLSTFTLGKNIFALSASETFCLQLAFLAKHSISNLTLLIPDFFYNLKDSQQPVFEKRLKSFVSSTSSTCVVNQGIENSQKAFSKDLEVEKDVQQFIKNLPPVPKSTADSRLVKIKLQKDFPLQKNVSIEYGKINGLSGQAVSGKSLLLREIKRQVEKKNTKLPWNKSYLIEPRIELSEKTLGEYSGLYNELAKLFASHHEAKSAALSQKELNKSLVQGSEFQAQIKGLPFNKISACSIAQILKLFWEQSFIGDAAALLSVFGAPEVRLSKPIKTLAPEVLAVSEFCRDVLPVIFNTRKNSSAKIVFLFDGLSSIPGSHEAELLFYYFEILSTRGATIIFVSNQDAILARCDKVLDISLDC